MNILIKAMNLPAYQNCKLLSFGLIEGALITVKYITRKKESIALRIGNNNTLISLSKDLANLIMVDALNPH